MDAKLLLAVFSTVFVADLGDKTQLSTMLYASSAPSSKWAVFVGSALALVVSSALGVFAGAVLGSQIDAKLLNRIAGIGFIAVGVWTFTRA